jgi:hypothetical protein
MAIVEMSYEERERKSGEAGVTCFSSTLEPDPVYTSLPIGTRPKSLPFLLLLLLLLLVGSSVGKESCSLPDFISSADLCQLCLWPMCWVVASSFRNGAIQFDPKL